MEEGDMASCFCSGPRTGGSGANVSQLTTGRQKGNKWSGVHVGKHIFPPLFTS